MLVAVIGAVRRTRSTAAPGHVRCSPTLIAHLALSTDDAEVAVPRLLHRVRDQGAAVCRSTPGCPTPAPRRRPARPCCWSACSTRSARSASCGYCLPLFPAASHYFARLVITLSVIGILYGAFARDRPARHEAAGRLHLGRRTSASSRSASSPSPPRASPARRSTWSTTASSTGALFIVVGLLIAGGGSQRSPTTAASQKVAPLLAGLFLLAGLAALALPGHEHVRQRVPGAGRHVHPVRGCGRRSPRSASSWPLSTSCGCTSAR